MDYKSEFWSEIIASEIGAFFEFNTLKYDIAYQKGEIGCLSKSMIYRDTESLIEGKSILTRCNNQYNPEKDKCQYTFQFIIEALSRLSLEKNTELNLKQSVTQIIKTIIFDSIIGNGDRHQENWGFISENIRDVKHIKNDENILGNIIRSVFWRNNVIKTIASNAGTFKYSPIYDSGSCLGREITDERLDAVYSDEGWLNSYIEKGKSEIHWNNKKITHFELISNLREDIYERIVDIEIRRISNNFNLNSIKLIVDDIDEKLPENLKIHKLQSARKQFITKLIELRVRKLEKIIQ